MARSRSDISNSAIRIFLQKVGVFYDEARGLQPFKSTRPQKAQLLDSFDSKCCYCDISLDISTISQDHLIPMNKDSLGLHAWGNVVPSCKTCNAEKQQKHWHDFMTKFPESERVTKRAKIQRERWGH